MCLLLTPKQQEKIGFSGAQSQYPDAPFVCGGDKNDLNVNLLLNFDPRFRQIVSKPTYGSQGPGREKSWRNVTFFLNWEAGTDRLKQKFT